MVKLALRRIGKHFNAFSVRIIIFVKVESVTPPYHQCRILIFLKNLRPELTNKSKFWVVWEIVYNICHIGSRNCACATRKSTRSIHSTSGKKLEMRSHDALLIMVCEWKFRYIFFFKTSFIHIQSFNLYYLKGKVNIKH